jgi:hypothetical protein
MFFFFFVVFGAIGTWIGVKVGFKLAESHRAAMEQWLAEVSQRGNRSPRRSDYDVDDPPRR